MQTLGRKLKNTSAMLGRKAHNVEKLGMKTALKATQIGKRVGHAVDVGARKVGNTTERIASGIGAVQPYVSGTPLEALGTLGRDAAKGVQMASKGIRSAAKGLEKESKLGHSAIDDLASSSFL